MYTCDVAGWNIMDYIKTDNFGAGNNTAKNKTSQETIDLVTSGLVGIGLQKSRAKKIVEMCNNKYYDDAEKLFQACLPHIN